MALNYLTYMDDFGLPRSGIIHVGANNAAEARFYAEYGDVPVAFFEPIPEVYQKALEATQRFPQQKVYHACCAEVDGRKVTFNVSSNRGMSSSMFGLGRHGELSPGITYVEQFEIKTSRAETILKQDYRLDDFNLAVIDTQGADLLVLQGLGEFLDHLEAIYIEISDRPLYEGGCTFDQIYNYLNERGFNLAMLATTVGDWGNAFFKRRDPLYVKQTREAVSRDKPATMSSVYNGMNASLGNDGDIVNRHKYFHTEKEDQPWWQVDLLEETPIRTIYLYDRPGQGERAKSLVVDVSSDGVDYRPVYDRAGKVLDGKSVTRINWTGSARYVRLRLQDKDYLHLRQVAVVADPFAGGHAAKAHGAADSGKARRGWRRK